MNKNGYLNFIATIILIVLLIMCYVLVTALDRFRFSVDKLAEAVRNIPAQTLPQPFVQSQNSSDITVEVKSYSVTPLDPKKSSELQNQNGKDTKHAANYEFFDKNAVPGGRLISAILSDTNNMNSLINNDATLSAIYSNAMDSLAERNYANIDKFEPQMAESWAISDDKMSYRIKLRKGILWHDFKDPVTGKEWKDVEVTAEDFKFYVDTVKNEAVDCAPQRVYMQDLDRVEVINDHEFVVHWKKPYFLSLEMTLSLNPLPRHLYHAYEGPFDGKKFNDDHERNRMLVGCGPYRFVKWEKGKRLIMKRFEKYYGRTLGTMPAIETLSFDVIQHPNTRLQALLSSELDRDALTPDQWINRTSTPAFAPGGFLEKVKYPSMSYNYIGFNQNFELFKSRNVRIALSHLVDRNRIIKDVYFDLARPISGPFFIDSPSYDKTIAPYEFSVEKAKKILADDGWTLNPNDGIMEKDGKKLKFTLMYPNVQTTYQKMLPMIKEDMAKAGVQMELLPIEWTVLVQRLEKKKFEACCLGWTSGLSPDPYQLWHSSQAEVDSSSNHIAFRNKRADELIEAIRVCFDTEERNRLYHEFHKLIHDEEPYIFLFSPYILGVWNKRYQNRRVFATGVPTNILWVPKDKQLQVPGL